MDGWHYAQFARLRTAYAQADPDNPLRQEPLERLYWGVLVLRLPLAAHEAIIERLALRGETQQFMAGLRVLQEQQVALNAATLLPSQVVTYLDHATPAAVALWIALDVEPALTPLLTRYLAEWRHVRPLLNGHALRKLGLSPGPLFSKILTRLRAARLDGQLSSLIEEEAFAYSIAQGG